MTALECGPHMSRCWCPLVSLSDISMQGRQLAPRLSLVQAILFTVRGAGGNCSLTHSTAQSPSWQPESGVETSNAVQRLHRQQNSLS